MTDTGAGVALVKDTSQADVADVLQDWFCHRDGEPPVPVVVVDVAAEPLVLEGDESFLSVCHASSLPEIGRLRMVDFRP